ncbi:WSSV562 [White spot syndrome virus]|uniref:WSSV562 n=1 Tax=White spot syndrome virus TaxID=342409 RepID=A0A2I6SCK8_9VIRU|nr:WSSV562 [White spot syndrome virus]
MNNDNTNSSGYAEGMVTKILNIIGKIPYNEMSRENSYPLEEMHYICTRM